MTAPAKLVLRPFGPPKSRHDPEAEALEEVAVFEGDVQGAVAAARALKPSDLLIAYIETADGLFCPDEFDSLEAGQSSFRDVDLAHGSLTIRVQADTLRHLQGDRAERLPVMSIISEHLDPLNAVVARKRERGEIEEIDGQRVLIVAAADLA